MVGNHEFQEYKTPGQVASLIGVSVPTLRKYSLMIEKATNGHYFERNQQNTRLYTVQNIADLRELTKLSKNPDMTLQEVIAQLFAMTAAAEPDAASQENANVSPIHNASGANEIAPVEQFMNVLTNMQDTITSQRQSIDQLQAQLRIVQDQNLAILERLNDSQGLGNFEEGIRIPENSTAVRPDEPAPGVTMPSHTRPKPGLQENESEATKQPGQSAEAPAQKAAETLADGSEANHSADLAADKKVVGDFEPTEEDEATAPKSYAPRTLADMQVDDEPKKHWWQRLLNQ